MDKCADLLPDHFRFVKGVVDSSDFSLNISREVLQHTRQLKVIASALEKKIKNELLKMQKEDFEKYLKFWSAFGTQLTMSKEDRIRYRGTSGTHVMTFSGVELDENGAPVRWKVHNSYGPQMGIQGHYVMDDSWFDEYVLSVVIDKRFAPPEIVAAYETAPETIDPGEFY